MVEQINKLRARIDRTIRQYRSAIQRNNQDRAWDYEIGGYVGQLNAMVQSLLDLGVSQHDGIFEEIDALPEYRRTDRA